MSGIQVINKNHHKQTDQQIRALPNLGTGGFQKTIQYNGSYTIRTKHHRENAGIQHGLVPGICGLQQGVRFPGILGNNQIFGKLQNRLEVHESPGKYLQGSYKYN